MKSLSKFGVEFHQAKLKNGANVFLFRRKGMPIYLRAAFFAGSRFDKVMGTAHFLEHMLVVGTKKFPSKNLMSDSIQRIGGEFSASTDASFIRINVEIPLKEDLDVGIEVLNECLTQNLFDSVAFEKERDVILTELKNKQSTPKEFVWDLARMNYMQGTTVAGNNLGTEESIRSITLDILRTHLENYVHAGRVTYIASGDVEIEELVSKLELIELRKGDNAEPGEPLPIIREVDTAIRQYPGISQLQTLMTIRTLAKSYKEVGALHVLNGILASGRGSRLMTKLRYENGLIYNINGNVYDAVDWGIMNIQFSCDKDKLNQIQTIIYSEFDDLRKNNITLNELESTKSRISKGSIRQMQTSSSWVNFHEVSAAFTPGGIHTIEDYIHTTANLTLDDISKVINTYLNKDSVYTAICGEV